MFECDGENLIIHDPLVRDVNEEEQAVLDGWYRVRDEYLKENPYAVSISWKMKDYFNKSRCPWMYGYEKVNGMYYGNGKVMDYHVPGDGVLKYRIHYLEPNGKIC